MLPTRPTILGLHTTRTGLGRWGITIARKEGLRFLAFLSPALQRTKGTSLTVLGVLAARLHLEFHRQTEERGEHVGLGGCQVVDQACSPQEIKELHAAWDMQEQQRGEHETAGNSTFVLIEPFP